MSQVLEFFRKLTDTSDWPPRWHCGNWTDLHGWLYITGNLLIWSAYFAIPLIIIRYISRRRDVHFSRLYFLFATFILACGTTHFFDAVAFWLPTYRLNALLLMGTGVISWLTAFSLIKILPNAFELKSSKELEKEIEQRIKAEEALKKKNAQLIEAQKIARISNWEWDIATNTVTFSGEYEGIHAPDHLQDGIDYDHIRERVHPEDQAHVRSMITKALEEKKPTEYYYRITAPDGQVRNMLARGEVVLNDQHEVVKLVGTRQDVTEQKRAEQVILNNSQKLQALNTELQQFAYVASHDLQEPLRKITTYASLLEREAKDSMSENGSVYINKIISSSVRMKNLIHDILNFSRLNVEQVAFSPVDLNAVVSNVLGDMEVLIQKTGAAIQVCRLPEIEGHDIQLGQLFQNIISNGIKFCRLNEKPQLRIWAERVNGLALPDNFVQSMKYQFSVLNDPRYWESESFCKIYIADNGIGFDEVYLDKLFEIFERLHNKSAYEGTGIGLAICKKIVENHHGVITAESKPGKGATFIIILPLSQAIYR